MCLSRNPAGLEMTSDLYKSRVMMPNVELRVLLIQGVNIVATSFLLLTVVAAHQAPEPSQPPASSSPPRFCSRPLAATLWGGAFAFFSLMADAWGASSALDAAGLSSSSWSTRMFVTLLLGPTVPLVGIFPNFMTMFVSLRFTQILSRRSSSIFNPNLTLDFVSRIRKLIGDTIVMWYRTNHSLAFKTISVIFGTQVVIGVRTSTKLPNTHTKMGYTPTEEGMVRAFTTGQKVHQNVCILLLSEAGKEALLNSNILPDYEGLQFLKGKSSLTAIIVAIQAIGYITAAVIRVANGLVVSPIEGIGFAFSILVIFHSITHFVGCVSHHSLLIYLNPEQEEEMLREWNSTQWSNNDIIACWRMALVAITIVGSTVVALTIVVEWQVLREGGLNAMGPIFSLLALILQVVSMTLILRQSSSTILHLHSSSWICDLCLFFCAMFGISIGSLLLSLGGMVVAVVATIMHWQHNNFDIHTPSVVHNLPFLG